MINDCKYLVDDGLPSTGGCSRCFTSCPYYVRDNMDMSCGGTCYECDIEEEDEEVKDSELEDMELDLEELKKDIKQKKYDLIFDITGLQPDKIRLGDWDCEKSPTGKCVYDIIEDPCRDHCVFCGEPDERK